jgi:16S rRNA (adenine1518-N6/adenine1519-N6)-dimethyltransferase
VDSAVIRLTPYPVEQLPGDRRLLDQLLRLGFANRRKMLRNNLKGLIDPEQFSTVLEQLALPGTARAEDLSLEQWLELTNLLPTFLPPT